jgi:hypothetical protein
LFRISDLGFVILPNFPFLCLPFVASWRSRAPSAVKHFENPIHSFSTTATYDVQIL